MTAAIVLAETFSGGECGFPIPLRNCCSWSSSWQLFANGSLNVATCGLSPDSEPTISRYLRGQIFPVSGRNRKKLRTDKTNLAPLGSPAGLSSLQGPAAAIRCASRTPGSPEVTGPNRNPLRINKPNPPPGLETRSPLLPVVNPEAPPAGRSASSGSSLASCASSSAISAWESAPAPPPCRASTPHRRSQQELSPFSHRGRGTESEARLPVSDDA
jgi:hypothetical protein